MPVKPLPPRPDLDHLKGQAQELLEDCARRDPRACQRLREFHPRFEESSDADISAAKVGWSDGLLAIAREHGFASWARLKVQVRSGRSDAGRPWLDRVSDLTLRRAFEAIDDGDVDGLTALLAAHPDLVTRRAQFEGENYFRSPALLAFIAENPVRNGTLPPNIADIAHLLLDRGAARNPADVAETLALVASGRIPREAGVQGELIALLVGRGADPDAAMAAALIHGEFGAARTLVDRGARQSLAFAAATGDVAVARALLSLASTRERHLGLALAAQHGRVEVLDLLLDAGEDPNRFNPPGAHSHSTPLHQAAWNGHEAVVRRLLERGANKQVVDTLWNGTPAGWARHAGQETIAGLLEGTS